MKAVFSDIMMRVEFDAHSVDDTGRVYDKERKHAFNKQKVYIIFESGEQERLVDLLVLGWIVEGIDGELHWGGYVCAHGLGPKMVAEPIGENLVRVSRVMGSGTMFKVGSPYSVTVSLQSFATWRAGTNIQEALPGTPPDVREFLMSGMTDAEFEKMNKIADSNGDA